MPTYSVKFTGGRYLDKDGNLTRKRSDVERFLSEQTARIMAGTINLPGTVFANVEEDDMSGVERDADDVATGIPQGVEEAEIVLTPPVVLESPGKSKIDHINLEVTVDTHPATADKPRRAAGSKPKTKRAKKPAKVKLAPEENRADDKPARAHKKAWLDSVVSRKVPKKAAKKKVGVRTTAPKKGSAKRVKSAKATPSKMLTIVKDAPRLREGSVAHKAYQLWKGLFAKLSPAERKAPPKGWHTTVGARIRKEFKIRSGYGYSKYYWWHFRHAA